jgi:hypothetical protein
MKTSWEIFTPFSHESFKSIINNFYDESKTVMLWKNGMLNKESCCDLLITYNDSKISIAARMIDPSKGFGIQNSKIIMFFKRTFFKYYIHVIYELSEKSIPFQVTYKFKLI